MPLQQRQLMVSWFWSISPVRKVWELGLSAVSSTCINTWREGAKRTEPGTFQWHPGTGPEAVSTNWNTGGSVLASGNTFSLWGLLSTRTSFPGMWRSLHPWRSSKAAWAQSWETYSRWSCLSGGVGPDDLQGSLTTSNILWFFDSVK